MGADPRQLAIDELAEQVLAFLSGLGGTHDGVATYLRERQITGRRNCSGACPIARLIEGAFPHVTDFGVEDEQVYLFHGAETSIESPPAVAAFVRRFDSGEYPDLDSDWLESLGRQMDTRDGAL